jgi:beta-glucosidase-like glycosyl hydrolase
VGGTPPTFWVNLGGAKIKANHSIVLRNYTQDPTKKPKKAIESMVSTAVTARSLGLGAIGAAVDATTWCTIIDESLNEVIEDTPHEEEESRINNKYRRKVATMARDNPGAKLPALKNSATKSSSTSSRYDATTHAPPSRGVKRSGW